MITVLFVAVTAFVLFTMVRFMRLPSYVWALAGAAAMLWPVLAGLAAGEVGTALGCEVNEAGAFPCRVGGVDLGGVLGTFAVLPWLGFFTVPFAAVLVFVAAVLAVAHFRRKRPPSLG